MKTIQLIETRNGCAMMERTPRFDVLLHGAKVGQLYFNLRGYVGTLPTPEGGNLSIGEVGIAAYKREVAKRTKLK